MAQKPMANPSSSQFEKGTIVRDKLTRNSNRVPSYRPWVLDREFFLIAMHFFSCFQSYRHRVWQDLYSSVQSAAAGLATISLQALPSQPREMSTLTLKQSDLSRARPTNATMKPKCNQCANGPGSPTPWRCCGSQGCSGNGGLPLLSLEVEVEDESTKM